MNIESLLLARKNVLAEKWFEVLVNSYPPETAKMLKRESNQFANPVGRISQEAMSKIVDEFLGENRSEEIYPLLDRIIRIRAIQEFSPSRALAFVFLLKNIVREMLKSEIAQGQVSPDHLAEFDERVDGLALAAMDVYSKCRDTLHEVQVREIKDRTHRLLLRAELLAEIPPQKPEDKQV